MKRILPLLVVGALAAPAAALAQVPSRTVTVTGNVAQACVLGAPTDATLDFGQLTDSTTGRLRAALASTAPAGETVIENAWCNTPSTITLTASPLTMTAATTPSYALQTGFARAITYTVSLTNWSADVSNRPLAANAEVEVASQGAQAAAPSMNVVFNRLAPLVGGSENANAFIEAGQYAGTVTIKLAVN